MTAKPARSRAARSRAPLGVAGALLAAALALSASAGARAEKRATAFRLDNGVELLVIPDHRAPLVNHSVWYRSGAADDPRGASGVAHFLEHLMFKGTEKYPPGALDKAIARIGGQNNAETGSDSVRYFEQVAREHLRLVMDIEADRMTNLRLSEADVLTERKVILEERRSTVDNTPASVLVERMRAALYLAHPYRNPVIGWEEEMKTLSRDDALACYRRVYAPSNALVVVSGDVTPADVLALARETYGRIPSGPALPPRRRPAEPEPAAARRITLTDARAGQATLARMYLAPAAAKASGRENEALALLASILGSSGASRLYDRLVIEEKKAATASAGWSGNALDSGVFAVSAIASEGASLKAVEASIDAVIADVQTQGVTSRELERARGAALAALVYEADDVAQVADRYGQLLMAGMTVEQAERRADAIAAVTAADVQDAARAWLQPRRSVTGWLLPGAPTPQEAAR